MSRGEMWEDAWSRDVVLGRACPFDVTSCMTSRLPMIVRIPGGIPSLMLQRSVNMSVSKLWMAAGELLKTMSEPMTRDVTNRSKHRVCDVRHRVWHRGSFLDIVCSQLLLLEQMVDGCRDDLWLFKSMFVFMLEFHKARLRLTFLSTVLSFLYI